MAEQNPSRHSRQRRQRIQLLLLVVLTSIGVYLWSAPMRAELALKALTLSQLQEAAKRQPDNPQVLCYLGKRLNALAQFTEARDVFARAAKLDPNNQETWRDWAAASIASGDDETAFSALTTLTRSHPENEHAHLDLALLLIQKGLASKAYGEAVAATKVAPGDAVAWRLAGVAALETHEDFRAEAALRHATTLAPNDWHAQLALGNALYNLAREKEALVCYQAAVKSAPDEATALSALGKLMVKRAITPEEIEAGRNVLVQALTHNPQDSGALYTLGHSLVRLQKWQEARTALEQAEQLAPNISEIHFDLAVVYHALGNPAAATRETKEHAEMAAFQLKRFNLRMTVKATKSPITRLELAQLCAEHGETMEAMQQYHTILLTDPNNGPAKRGLSQLAEQAQAPSPTGLNTSPAVVSAIPAATNATNTSDALLKDADDMMALKRYPEAEQAYHNLTAQFSHNASAFEGLGFALNAQHKVELAFMAFQRAVQLDPKRSKSRFALAQIYYAQGYIDEAAKRVAALLQEQPDNPDFLYALSECYRGIPVKNADVLLMLQKANRLSPGQIRYLRSLAAALVENHQEAAAEPILRQALKLAPDDPLTTVQLGTFLLDHRPVPSPLPEAEVLFQRCLSSNPKNADAVLGLARVAQIRGDNRQAASLLQQAVTLAPGLTAGWYTLSGVYERLGQHEDADKCRAVFNNLTKFNFDLGHTEELARTHGTDPQLRLKLARLYVRSEQYDKAISQYQVYLYLNPKDTKASQELETMTVNLKAMGKMPSMQFLNAIMLASARTR